MEIWLNLGWVLLGLVCLYFGAEWLVKGAVAIAMALGIPALIVALTIVAFGTSAPELLVSVDANLKGKGDFALGNVIGSNICNLAMVLGIGALVRPISVNSQLIKREMPILIFASIGFVAMLFDREISRIDGVILTLSVIAYTFFSIYIGKRDPEDAIAATSDAPLVNEDEPESQHDAEGSFAEGTNQGNQSKSNKYWLNISLLIVGFGLLVLGANRLVYGGENLARTFGVPDAIIALTLVAFGTSLPELATSVVASWKNHGDIVTGNAVGSCIFNLLAVAGITACIMPIQAVDIRVDDLWVMLAFTAVTYLSIRKDFLVRRWEGALLLTGYLAYIVWLSVR